MSLFPAYEDIQLSGNTTQATTSVKWLENNSFAIDVEQVKVAQSVKLPTDEPMLVSSASSDDSDIQEIVDLETKKEHKHKSKKKHKKKSKQSEKEKPRFTEPVPMPLLDFDGAEDYYVDKKPVMQYKTMATLHKPACPKYRVYFRKKLGRPPWIGNSSTQSASKRYYKLKYDTKDTQSNSIALDENEYTQQMGQLNRKTLETPNELQVWLDLIKLQDRNPYRWSKLLLAEKKIDLIQRALLYLQRNEQLYRIYIEIITATYPAFEVCKLLDKMISKDPYNYTLWTAQIMNTQGSMARCIVPEVLRIYERCMQKMHHAQKKQHSEQASDNVMLKLFNNCALFLRQAGLYEQFFALIKLALELNVSTEKFGNFAPREADQNTLIEYEELILQSGLPMNELWLRIEKLRQGFNFLPYPEHSKCSDPQRIVFNEDVCHYIYPLKSRENSFYLILLILRLMKLPFIQSDVVASKFCARVEHIGDSDAIEDMLAVCIRSNYALRLSAQNDFLSILLELAKETAVSPTFINNTIGYEIYVRTLNELLLNCAACYANIDERKRIVFMTLWCRFERLLLTIQQLQKKLTPEYVKAMRSRFKALLKQPANRNVLNFYTEFAICEYEALDKEAELTSVANVFENLIAAHATADEAFASDLCELYLKYVEILLGKELHDEAIQVLVCYVLGMNIKSKSSISTARKLSAFKKLQEKLETIINVEKNVTVMVLEQYLLPDFTLSLLKMYIYMQCLLGQRLEALAYLDKLLKIFQTTNERHNFLREQLWELYMVTLQLKMRSGCLTTPALLSKKVTMAIAEYPRNLVLLQTCSMLSAMPAYQLRSAMLSSTEPSIHAVIFLIAAARLRFLQTRSTPPLLNLESIAKCDQQHNESIVRNRILNMFGDLTSSMFSSNNSKTSSSSQNHSNNALRRNALFWRCYLRCLSDQNTAFETSKKCLLSALDECPWSKALYLDGGTYVPQELAHLQDLIIEKQLRIYALPEELEILRER